MNIYKYRNFSKDHITSVMKNEIWFSLGAQFNDPFDCKPPLKILSKESMKLFLLEKLENASTLSEDDVRKLAQLNFDEFTNNLNDTGSDIAHIVNTFFSVINKCFISCFSKVNNSLLMWSHYSYNHTGFCVGYNLEKILKTVDLSDHGEVSYENRIKDFLEESKLEHFEKAARNVMFQKCEEWSYEKEYRLIHGEIAMHKDDKFKNIALGENSVVTIYFGCKSLHSDREMLMSKLKGRKIDFYLMRQSLDAFSLCDEKMEL